LPRPHKGRPMIWPMLQGLCRRAQIAAVSNPEYRPLLFSRLPHKDSSFTTSPPTACVLCNDKLLDQAVIHREASQHEASFASKFEYHFHFHFPAGRDSFRHKSLALSIHRYAAFYKRPWFRQWSQRRYGANTSQRCFKTEEKTSFG
jgi:hypothetical protein